MNYLLSIIIPNYNGSRTIGKCLEAVVASQDETCEVIVVDDCSQDGSIEIIRQYPCRLIRLERRSGASAARNAGASNSKGEFLFFIDSDCLLKEDTLALIRNSISRYGRDTVIGGTYTPRPHDPGFFSFFQSVYINYSETKNSDHPDYLATHAFVIRAELFRKMGGFKEKFLPIIEDVEFSHRLRSAGFRLIMVPDLQVEHIFNFSLFASLKNAIKKTEYWVAYSLTRRDVFADSGTASKEIKTTCGIWLAALLLELVYLLTGAPGFLMPLPLLGAAVVVVNRHLFKAFTKTGGTLFALAAAGYFILLYPFAVWIGASKGIVRYFTMNKRGWKQSVPPQSVEPERRERSCTRR